MERKSFEVTADTQPEGKFTARICTWNKPDGMGDVLRQGSFLESIERWQKKARKIPVIFNHKWDDIQAHVGEIAPDDLRETATGLEVSGSFYLQEETALKVFRQLERKALSEWSMGFTIQMSRPLQRGAREITKAHLLEAGPCLKGLGETETVSVKSGMDAEDIDRRARLVIEHDGGSWPTAAAALSPAAGPTDPTITTGYPFAAADTTIVTMLLEWESAAFQTRIQV